MEIFFSATSSFVNSIQQTNNTPVPPAPVQQPQPTQNATVDFSGTNTSRQSNIDSLGGGRLL